ncbi:MAG: hypothetical protein QME96_11090, partial [Myxococcota bacterium]|nr:hypothetical protein [Myxococcota bacterium]
RRASRPRSAARPSGSISQTIVMGEVRERRRCIIPQATRQLVAPDVCGDPLTSGWYYVPAGQGEIEGCHQVLITDDIELEAGSTRRVECLTRL